MFFFHSAAVMLGAGLAAASPAAIMREAVAPVQVLEYDNEAAYTRFELRSDLVEELTSPLVFEFQADPVPAFTASNITLNQQDIPIDWNWGRNRSADWPPSLRALAESSSFTLSAKDNRGHEHALDLSLRASVIVPEKLISVNDNVTQHFSFIINSIDDIALSRTAGFAIITKPTSDHRLYRLLPLRDSGLVEFDNLEPFTEDSPMLDDDFSADGAADDVDIEAEIESLLRLEDKAGNLDAQIAAKKQRLATCLKTHRDEVGLQRLLEQCDGLVCAAKVIAQKICDKIGIQTEPSFSYAQLGDPHYQHLISSEGKDRKSQPPSKNTTKTAWEMPTKSDQPTLLSVSTHKGLDWSNPTSALIRVLGIIASAIGLTALIKFLHRKCMSPRSRAERDADAEERRNARAYRRAARRAYLRQRWHKVVAAVNCFKQQAPIPSRIEDYEEKRALILQDAFLEQSLEQAEKGEVMEAEIRELRHAHEIVSSMVHGGVVEQPPRHFDLIMPIHDPPPPRVPLPFTPISRSRASTGTLPSYTSESLPGYTSQLATEMGSSTHSLSSDSLLHSPVSASASDHGRFSIGSTTSSDAGGEPYAHPSSTPTSSVLDISRPSEDTLRTLRSMRSAHL